MKTLALLVAAAVTMHADDGFARWFKQFQSAVAKGNGEQVTDRSEFPMDWEYGSNRKIPARSVLVGRFDLFFTDEIKRAVADGKPVHLQSGEYMITWKAKGNEYSMYFRASGAAFALAGLSEGPP